MNIIFASLLRPGGRLLFAASILGVLVGCQHTSTSEAEDAVAERPFLNSREVVIGYLETFRVAPEGVEVNARMDTGATTSSINAQEITRFERDSEPWVRFTLVDEATGEESTLERAVAREVRIRQHSGEADERYVVELEIFLGDRHLKGEFTLADRSNFNFKGLLGRNLLGEGYLVDSSTSNVLGQPAR